VFVHEDDAEVVAADIARRARNVRHAAPESSVPEILGG
jgi:hypothetical protein